MFKEISHGDLIHISKMGTKQARYINSYLDSYIHEASSTLSTNNCKNQMYTTNRTHSMKPLCSNTKHNSTYTKMKPTSVKDLATGWSSM